MKPDFVLVLVIVVIVALAGLFAGAETGMYRLSRLRLRLGVEKRRLPFTILGLVMRDSPGLLLTMLVGTNLAHYAVTSIVTLMLLGRTQDEHTAELFSTFITVPTLFVFSELIPKNIFFYRADVVMPFCSPILLVFHKLFTWSGIVPALKVFSRFFARVAGTPISAKTVISDAREHHIKAILHETREEAFLSPVQADIIDRIVTIPNIRLKSVMTPMSRVELAPQDSDRSVLLAKLQTCPFTRLPVCDGSGADIVGFIHLYECLGSEQDFTDLRSFLNPIRSLSGDTIVSEAINIMQKENQRIILVTRAGQTGREKPIGIVTMKDLVEELLGELAEW